MLHGNHSSPALRPSPPKPNTSGLPAQHADDGLSLDRLRIADESFTPPTRSAAQFAPFPSSTNGGAGGGPTGLSHQPPPPESPTVTGHTRRQSSLSNTTASPTRSLRGAARQRSFYDEDRPLSGGSFAPPATNAEGGEAYMGIGDGGGADDPNRNMEGAYGHPGDYGPGPSYGGMHPQQHQQPQDFYGHPNGGPFPTGPEQGYPMQPGYPYGQPQMVGGPPPQGFYPGPQGPVFPPPGPMGYPGPYGPGPSHDPYPSQPGHLNRANTSGSSFHSGSGFGRTATGVSTVSSSAPSTSRRSGDTRGPMISKASIDEYRNRIKNDPDPEAHFNFAKFLIEAAKKLASGGAAGDVKAIKKYRDALLQESLKLIKRLATQGLGLGKPAYADAQFFLANCLGNGSLGLQVDHEKAYNLYVQASKQNHPQATFRTAVCNELGAGTRKDANRAVLFYRKASALGDTAGMYKLGMILLNGLLGQQRNPKEALLWLKRAAGQADEDNPHALHELAMLYEKPVVLGQPPAATLLVPHDEGYARELYTQAAQLGYAPSQNRLGSCYEYGALTCPIDPRRSIAWYTRAAERGDAESELALSGWYLTGSDGVLKQSDSEAYLWARRAANKGLPKAEYAVGYYSEVGIGVKQDIDEAKRWYMRAASTCHRSLCSVPSIRADPCTTANKNKRAMQRLAELKKMGAQKVRSRQKLNSTRC